MTATVTSSHDAAGWLRIYIAGKLHLLVSTKRLAGVQAWTDSKIREPAMYFIEVTPTKGSSILAEYDREDLWRGVLAAIDGAFGAARTDTATSTGEG